MEELLKEILVEVRVLNDVLAELKQINSGVIMSADDMRMLLDREKEVLNQRSRSIFSTVPSKNNEEINKAFDKKTQDTDLSTGLFNRVGRSEFIQLGNVFAKLGEIKCINIDSKGRVNLTWIDNTSFAGICTVSDITGELF